MQVAPDPLPLALEMQDRNPAGAPVPPARPRGKPLLDCL
jgi:hypothetical protein